MCQVLGLFFYFKEKKKRLVQEATNLENDLAKYLNQ